MTSFHPMDPSARDSDISCLEIFDVAAGSREVAARIDHLIEAPNWTPDGSALIFNSRGRLYRFTLATRDIREIDTGFADNCNNDHVICADGERMAISHGSAEDGASRIYTLPLAGGTPQLVTALGQSYLHGWSPDGSTLAFCGGRADGFHICTIPAKGGAEIQLTHGDFMDDGPEYDPSGSYIWFNSTRTGRMQVFRMDAHGGHPVQMTFDDDLNTWFPHVSPNGRQVVMLSYRFGDLLPHEHLPRKNVVLRLMDRDGGNLRTIAALFGGQGTINVNSWSPCSTKFAFVSYRLSESPAAGGVRP